MSHEISTAVDHANCAAQKHPWKSSRVDTQQIRRNGNNHRPINAEVNATYHTHHSNESNTYKYSLYIMADTADPVAPSAPEVDADVSH